MKKFMFSAVALVVFSFAGMASNGEVEKLEVKNELKKIKLVELHPCVMEGLAAAGAVQDMNGTPAQCIAAAEKAEKNCRARKSVSAE